MTNILELLQTSLAYQALAFNAFAGEASFAARALQLPIPVPIVESNLI